MRGLASQSARSALPFAVELLPGFQVDGTWNVPTTLFRVDGTWNVPTTFLQEFTKQCAQVGGAATVAPFVVIPRYYLDQLALVAQDLCEVRSENAAVRIVDDVARNDWVFGVA